MDRKETEIKERVSEWLNTTALWQKILCFLQIILSFLISARLRREPFLHRNAADVHRFYNSVFSDPGWIFFSFPHLLRKNQTDQNYL